MHVKFKFAQTARTTRDESHCRDIAAVNIWTCYCTLQNGVRLQLCL